ncbi:desulfoferrodoxin FeS4 iron-binding domain-containing protein [Patescibacteria group bacterium]
MIELNQIYKCNICGNEVEIVKVGGGQLKCCETEMQLVESNENEE